MPCYTIGWRVRAYFRGEINFSPPHQLVQYIFSLCVGVYKKWTDKIQHQCVCVYICICIERSQRGVSSRARRRGSLSRMAASTQRPFYPACIMHQPFSFLFFFSSKSQLRNMIQRKMSAGYTHTHRWTVRH